MSEPTPWAIISVLGTIGLIGTYIFSELNWKRDANRIMARNYLLREIGGLETLSAKGRKNLDGVSRIVSRGASASVLVPHLNKHGFQEPKGDCGWLDEPIRKDLSDFNTCYLNVINVRNCDIFYMVAVKYDDARNATSIVGTHFAPTCFKSFS